MEERKLATIRRITTIQPIEGKDRIGLALVDGWTVIVQKAEFEPGGLCVYCEIDSKFPERPEYEFLRKNDFRIRTMKMAGCISQGICFPLSVLPQDRIYELGEDVTELMGITKWERPDATDVKVRAKSSKKKYPKFLMKIGLFRWIVKKLNGKTPTDFPSFLHKTDETRIQNAPFYLNLKTSWVVTEKLDGQSGTFAVVKHKGLFRTTYEYIVCSRNYRLWKKDTSSYWSVSDRYEIEKNLTALLDILGCEWVAVQGECLAPGVQGNKYKLTEPDLYLFNLITPKGRWDSIGASGLMSKYGFKWVPIIETLDKLPDSVQEMLEYAHGDSALGHTIREGVVCRSADGSLSFKAVDPEFLLKYHE